MGDHHAGAGNQAVNGYLTYFPSAANRVINFSKWPKTGWSRRVFRAGISAFRQQGERRFYCFGSSRIARKKKPVDAVCMDRLF
jgi:hypothetical protein